MVTVTELNRAPNITANAIDAASVSASDSITDPAGNTVTDLSDPVRVTEEASTFAESDVTVTNANTEVSNGSIQLTGSQTSGDALIEWDSGVPADIDSWDLATFQRTLDGETVTIDVGYQAQEGVFPDDFEDGVDSGWDTTNSDGTLEAVSSPSLSGSQSGAFTSSSSNDSIISPSVGPVTDKMALTLQIDTPDGDGDYILFRVYDDSFNIMGELFFNPLDKSVEWGPTSDILLTDYWRANDPIEIEYIPDFTNNEVSIAVDSQIFGPFAMVNNMSSWDSVDISNRTNATGITRTVYVDTKTEFVAQNMNINQDFDISNINTSNNVQLRANLSRNDTSNNPTLDYAARRFSR